ncbi:LTA synthase family protein [Mucilaginibacter sp. RS28]|uniref:LTA synthase family protein n=1 Tax=Mucilaginibacter straminoryzae TaxID=2932774 RepID=A0A9X1X233_9SPHI|nr:sulfatase-like hydrolase/transferase [Mucilaginibacter straminoryzae]MCJ8209588.1 LTA synthase family protein [Mucilaginibacter straminoryzae]
MEIKKMLFAALAMMGSVAASAQHIKSPKVVLVTMDGFRWQEVFRGADSALINSKYTDDKEEIKQLFWAPTAAQRRSKLLPFFWNTLEKKGQLYGDRDEDGKDQVLNPYNFSYPGYNEILTGFPDVRMNTNDPIPNPNMNVLEFVNKQKGFENKVAAFSSWEVFPAILNAKRSKLLVNSGFMDFTKSDAGDRLKYISKVQHEATKILGEKTRLDFATYEMGFEYMKQYKPRFLYLAFDETDDLAHEGLYKLYLKQAHLEDKYLSDLWNYIQHDPYYKDQTTLIITCDHGRGEKDPNTWTGHGQDIKESNQTWFAVIGPETSAKGIMKGQTYHNQLAQTIANLLGLDFKKAADHEVGAAIKTVSDQIK